MEDTIDYKELKRQMKREEFRHNVLEPIATKTKAIGKWYWDHKEVTVPVTVAVAGFATKGLGIFSRELAKQREVNYRALQSWDPRLGEWLELRRALTNTEKIILDSRMKAGERKVDILQSMGVLK